MSTYEVVRFYQDDARGEVILVTGVTLEEAQAHCNDPETSYMTATAPNAVRRMRMHGPWFDGYRAES